MILRRRFGPILPDWQLRITGNDVDGWRWSLEKVLMRRDSKGDSYPPPSWLSEKSSAPMQVIRGPRLCPTEQLAIRDALLVWSAEMTREGTATSYVIPLPEHPSGAGDEWAERISSTLEQSRRAPQPQRNGNGPRILLESHRS